MSFDEFIATASNDAASGSGGNGTYKIERSEDEPWGISIDHDSTYGLKIKGVKAGKAASKFSEIRAGRSVLTLNGEATKTLSKDALKAMLKSAQILELVFGPDYPLEATPGPASPGPASPDARSPGDDEWANKGRMAIIKALRAANIDYSAAPNVDALRDLARKHL